MSWASVASQWTTSGNNIYYNTGPIGISGDPLGGNGGVFKNIEIGSSGINTTTLFTQTNAAAGGIVVGGYATSSNTILYNVYSGQQPSRFSMNDGAFIFQNAPTGTAGNAITFTEQMRLSKTGALVLAGGSTSATGVGVTFPATQSASTDANTLDDYEEGTWTPAYNSSNSNMTITQTNFGYYRKVGSIVHVWIRALVSAISSSGTGDLNMTGLPFAAQTSNIYQSSAMFTGGVGNFSATSTPFSGFFNQGTTTWVCLTKSSSDVRSGIGVVTPSSALLASGNYDFWYGCYISN
jgi:hypothetical protein